MNGMNCKLLYLVSSASEFNHCQEYLFSKGYHWNSFREVDGNKNILLPLPDRVIGVDFYVVVTTSGSIFYQTLDGDACYREGLELIDYSKVLREKKLGRILR